MKSNSGWIFITLICFVAIVAIAIIFPAKYPVGDDVVGILSLLVTILIGWNIYSVIDLKSYKEKIVELENNFYTLRDEAADEIDRVRGVTKITEYHQHYIQWKKNRKKSNDCDALVFCLIGSLHHHLSIRRVQSCDVSNINNICQYLEEPCNRLENIDEYYREDLTKYLDRIDAQEISCSTIEMLAEAMEVSPAYFYEDHPRTSIELVTLRRKYNALKKLIATIQQGIEEIEKE